jgi:DNA-binding transcriptional LysR family regulator
VSLAVQRLETELGEKLIDREMRGAKELVLTDAGRVVFEHARRFHNLEQELASALAELRDRSAGRLTIGANESSTLYLLPHIERYRGRFPKIKVQIRRSQSSKIPAQLVEGDLELGVTSYDPGDHRLATKVLYNDALAFIVSPRHRLAKRRSVSISELGKETFIAHNVLSPYRDVVLREFQRHKVPLNMDV